MGKSHSCFQIRRPASDTISDERTEVEHVKQSGKQFTLPCTHAEVKREPLWNLSCLISCFSPAIPKSLSCPLSRFHPSDIFSFGKWRQIWRQRKREEAKPAQERKEKRTTNIKCPKYMMDCNRSWELARRNSGPHPFPDLLGVFSFPTFSQKKAEFLSTFCHLLHHYRSGWRETY